MGKNIDSVKVEPSEGDVVIASFANASGDLPKDININVYTNKKEEQSIIHGESVDSNLQFNGDELDDSKYLVGFFDDATNSIKLLKNSRIFNGRVVSNDSLINDAKLKKTLKRKTDYSKDGTFSERRNELGQEFGTKKAKKAIQEAAKNRIDSTLLEDSQVDIIDGIRETTKNMPNRDQMVKMVEKDNKVTPPCYPESKNVEDIYPISEIISDEILQFFPTDVYFNKESDSFDLFKNLPYIPLKDNGAERQKKSIIGQLFVKFLEDNSSLSNVDDKKWYLSLLSFTTMLYCLYFNRRASRRDKFVATFDNLPPSKAINFLISQFTNNKFKNNNFNFDKEIRFFNIGPKEEDKILCHIIVLLLTMNDFRLELSVLASDLSLKPSKLIALMRTLGCVIVPSKENKDSKIAILKVPFKAPDLVRRFKR